CTTAPYCRGTYCSRLYW
nr:immunoglobulin heavy chain junction region [Macaca mulatta]MOW23143.1 immunoglobulin heavy chain junction region [Macaca mulatta]MOW23160.1 immunoglobulin heavy chain junction region [Macaca mulatta]MOW23205.1 immunoglobulin heavy chain junction region [Macaca mulatta]MOW23363.1 immunoglobulin heavy chain junction region [Macaca mulatta]